jgi:aromatic-L-amino-acid decarboxylase
MRLARLFAGWIDAATDFERLAPVPFSVVCFRAVPCASGGGSAEDDRRGAVAAAMPREEIDAFNERLLEAINRTGEVFMSHTRLDGRYALRLAIGNLHTREAHVARAWTLLRHHAAQLRQTT